MRMRVLACLRRRGRLRLSRFRLGRYLIAWCKLCPRNAFTCADVHAATCAPACCMRTLNHDVYRYLLLQTEGAAAVFVSTAFINSLEVKLNIALRFA